MVGFVLRNAMLLKIMWRTCLWNVVEVNLLRKVSYEIEVHDPQLEWPCPLPAHSLQYPSTSTVPGLPLVNPHPHPVATGALVVPPVTKLSLRSPSGTVWPQGPLVSTSHFVVLPRGQERHSVKTY